MRIDAHQHFWLLERGDYGWLTPSLTKLYRDFLPGDLEPELQKAGMDRTVLVQAAPTVAETEYMLSLCEESPRIAGVVGWLDFEADDFEEQFLRLRENPYFVGLRPMLQDLEDDRWILRPKVISALRILEKHGFPLDILIFPRHLPVIRELMDIVPNLRGVIDHLAKPYIKDGIFQPWAEQIAELAKYPNLYCKLSGMVTEADHEGWRSNPAQFAPYVRHVVSSFGYDRIMFGSDWPVCLLAASYAEVVSLLESSLPEDMTDEQRRLLFGGNAARFYGLKL